MALGGQTGRGPPKPPRCPWQRISPAMVLWFRAGDSLPALGRLQSHGSGEQGCLTAPESPDRYSSAAAWRVTAVSMSEPRFATLAMDFSLLYSHPGCLSLDFCSFEGFLPGIFKQAAEEKPRMQDAGG